MLPHSKFTPHKQGKTPLRAISTAFWSEWGDSNSRLRHPKCRALPTGLHPAILLFFLWFSGPFFAVFSVYGRACGQRQKQWIGKSRFSQCFRHFLPLCSNGTDFSRSSQTTRATNCATPGNIHLLRAKRATADCVGEGWSGRGKGGKRSRPADSYHSIHHSAGGSKIFLGEAEQSPAGPRYFPVAGARYSWYNN